MIYDTWIGDAIGADWVRLGSLDLKIPGGFLGGASVSFYATEPALAPDLTSALKAFVPTLPDGVLFTFADNGAGAGG